MERAAGSACQWALGEACAGHPGHRMLLQPCRGGIFIAVRDVVPELTADECGKEPTGIGGTHDPGVFGGGQKGEACTVAWANQPVPLCLLEEGKEPRRIMQVIGDDVLEGGR